jgi:glutamate-5-semialdehyde dehydrogenase
MKEYVIEKAKAAKKAAKSMGLLSTEHKNSALISMANALISSIDYIIEENNKDMANGKGAGLLPSLLDRLRLDEKRILGMAEGMKSVAVLPDPIGEGVKSFKRPNDLKINQVRVPLGVAGIIYEARPNVTADAVALCIKSGNSVILRGGKEAIHSNIAIVKALKEGAAKAMLPEGCIQFIENTDREAVNILMKLNDYVDVLIPRGGAGLIQTVVNNSTVPVIETGVGNCHIYVDSSADLKMAENIIINAKTQRPGVCNAMETLLVNVDIAEAFLPGLARRLKEFGVEMRGDKETKEILPFIEEATEEDWSKEYLDLILAIKVVNSLDSALEHIDKYGSGHSEAIITNNYSNSQRFLKEVDAAVVYVNASTRFTDGFEFGFGAEIGISTQKLHARGPMGLEALTTIKYMVYGEGQVRK